MRKNADPEPDREADPDAWETWNAREIRRSVANARRRERRAARHERFVYPSEPFFALAEQTAKLTVNRPPPLLPWEVELTIRFLTPDPEHAEFGCSTSTWPEGVLVDAPLPFPKHVPISSAFNTGIHHALGLIEHPYPSGGYYIELIRLQVNPVPPPNIDIADLTRLTDVVEAAVAGAVHTLWASLIAAWERDRHLDTASVTRDLADFEQPAE